MTGTCGDPVRRTGGGALCRSPLGRCRTPRGLIEDVVEDAARVIRALGLTSVEVVGFLRGGMIAI